MRRLFIVCCLLFSLCLSNLLPPSICAKAQQAAPAVSNTLKLAGLRERVTVRRDERGIPYIEAANYTDLYFAQGFVTASDRLWQMDLMRRTARGELSEVLGRGPQGEVIAQDKLHRTFGFAQVAEAEAAAASKEAREMLEAYARGVNALVESLDAKQLPPEFQILGYRPRPWTPADSLLIIKLFFEVLSNTWQTDIMRAALSSVPAAKREALLTETSPLDVLVVGRDTNAKKSAKLSYANDANLKPGIDTIRALSLMRETMMRGVERLGLLEVDRAASNNWVVSGKRTATGKPLLANDPHLPPSAPSIWYMIHLSVPGMRVAGVTSPGLPGVVIGHNERIAWGFTNVGPDVSDVYIEKFDTENPRRYMTPGGWREAEVRREEIKVRKGFTTTETAVETLEVTTTRHGPIVLEKEGRRYALRWTALNPKLTDVPGFFALNQARNWKDFTAALAHYTAPMQNMVYADVDGHIGYYAAGRVPLRKSGDGSLPYDGSTDAGEWTGYIPFDKLPHVLDPPSGIIVTANQRITGTDYPYFLTHDWAAPYRARRILELVEAKQKLTADDFRAIQGDNYSIPAAIFARESARTLMSVMKDTTDEKLRAAVNSFQKWDARISPESSIAPLVSEMRTAFRQRIITAAIGAELANEYDWSNSETLVDKLLQEQPAEWLPKEFKSYAELLLACYADARSVLTKRMGADDAQWTWGKYLQVRFPHPLAGVPLLGQQFVIQPFAQNGSGGRVVTVNVGRGVSMRFIADTSDWERTQQGITLGESGIPSSPHWKDQLEDWRNVTPRVFPFGVTAVERAAKETVMLVPAS